MTAQVLAELELEVGAAFARARAKIRPVETSEPPPAPVAPTTPPPPATAPPGPRAGLLNPKAFFDVLRASKVMFGGQLTGDQVRTIEAVLTLCAGRLPLSWAAYCLATAYHEPGLAMVPVFERGNGDGPDADPWDDYLEKYDTGELARRLGNTPEADGDGVLWAGRGLVQLTGARNYAFANTRLHELGLLSADEDLTRTPDLALRLDVAAAILVFGMLEGWFTAKRLNDFVPAPDRVKREHYVAARRVVNGLDRADLIAGYAVEFERALRAGRYV